MHHGMLNAIAAPSMEKFPKRNDDKILTLDKRIFAPSTNRKENLKYWRILQTKEMISIVKFICILKGEMIWMILEKVGLL